MTEPERIREAETYVAEGGVDPSRREWIAPRSVTKRIETRWEFGVFVRIFKNGRLVVDRWLGKGGRSGGVQNLQQISASSGPDSGDSDDEPTFETYSGDARGGGNGGPIEETRTEIGVFLGKVTTETTSDDETG